MLTQVSQEFITGLERAIESDRYKGKKNNIPKVKKAIKAPALKETLAITLKDKYTLKGLNRIHDYLNFAYKNKKLKDKEAEEKARKAGIDIEFFKKTFPEAMKVFAQNLRKF